MAFQQKKSTLKSTNVRDIDSSVLEIVPSPDYNSAEHILKAYIKGNDKERMDLYLQYPAFRRAFNRIDQNNFE